MDELDWHTDYCSSCTPHADTWASVDRVGGVWKLEIGYIQQPAGVPVILFEGWQPWDDSCPPALSGINAASWTITGVVGTDCEGVEATATVDCLCCECPSEIICGSNEFNNQGSDESPATTGYLGGLGFPSFPNGYSEMTISAWVKFIPRDGEPNTLCGIIARARGDNIHSSDFKWILDSRMKWNPVTLLWEGPYFRYEVEHRDHVWSAVTPILNVWYHVVGMREVNPITNVSTLRIFVDTVEAVKVSADFTVRTDIGHCASIGEGICARICLVGGWDRALSSDEVDDLYNGGDGLWCYPPLTYQLQVWKAPGPAWNTYTDGDLASCVECDDADPGDPAWGGLFHRRYSFAPSACQFLHPYGVRKIDGKVLGLLTTKIVLPFTGQKQGLRGCHWLLDIRCDAVTGPDLSIWIGYKVDRDGLPPPDTCVDDCSDIARWDYSTACVPVTLPDPAPDPGPNGDFCRSGGCDPAMFNPLLRIAEVAAICIPEDDLVGYHNLIEGDGLISIERPCWAHCDASFFDCATPANCWDSGGPGHLCVPSVADCPSA